MKNRKSYYSLLLALALCLCLTACGGSGDTIDDGGEDYSGNEVNTPDSFEGMVKDSELATNYAMYWGTWVDADNNSELIVAMADSGDEVRFDLYQDGNIEASGFVQFSQEYSGDYFYNEFDGWAHHCWLADDGTLQIEGFGGFVGLFQKIAAVAFMRLLTVPRAAARRAQQMNDLPQILQIVVCFLFKMYHIYAPIARGFPVYAQFLHRRCSLSAIFSPFGRASRSSRRTAPSATASTP